MATAKEQIAKQNEGFEFAQKNTPTSAKPNAAGKQDGGGILEKGLNLAGGFFSGGGGYQLSGGTSGARQGGDIFKEDVNSAFNVGSGSASGGGGLPTWAVLAGLGMAGLFGVIALRNMG